MKRIYLIATVIAIIAGFATYLFANELKKNSTIKDVEKSQVVIAAVDIKENTILTEAMFIVRDVPVTAVAPGSVNKISDVVGKMAVAPMYSGEQVLAKRIALIADSDMAARLSYRVEPGKYAYTISMDYNSTIGGFAREGDYLDIYRNSGGELSLLLEKVKIVKISSYASNTPAPDGTSVEIKNYTDITVFLTRNDIMKLGDPTKAASLKMALVAYSDAVDISDDLIEDVSIKEIQTNAGNPIPPPTTQAAG